MKAATPETLQTAQLAFQYFAHALKTGEWAAFLAMLSEDFTFWFPIGAYQGENVGKDKAVAFFHSVTNQVFIGGLSLTLINVMSNETSVIFEVRSQGKMYGHSYQNQAAIVFEVRGEQICRYREYLGVLFRIDSSTIPE
ncbi:nuclear transport factor 2 family protein [Chroococcus sp. FPU101]|uniref:nuclear transport factor 2 family protein n=1 Tax=Chroococcus sp. FPU101 TaxID=1974212 RepID=UPI001A8E2670|nr:nuclear transport factor 2 family protein [Chroococcus sp. FPU101]GFE70451.1 hypothetical protein CFPU101_30610 [Chroococcus sp. FPU101]